MPKSYIKKRVKFLVKSDQKTFMESIQKSLGVSTKQIALLSKVSTRQISDWKNAKSTLSLYAFEKLTTKAKIARPDKIKVIDQYSHVKSAGKKGLRAVFDKYGTFPKNEKYRKDAWEKWWKNVGIHQKRKIFERKSVKIPEKSPELAELFGILIGDGGITKRQVRITLDSETDTRYSKFVMKLLQKLFKLTPKIYKVEKIRALNICISRSDLVDFLVKNGLKLGNKLEQDLSIPAWIMRSKKYLLPCIRGMVDTDGCVVVETHSIKNKKYTYYRLNFTSSSPTLINQTADTFYRMGFHPKLRRNSKSVQLENIAEIWEYFKRVGTSNPKHINRLRRSGSRGLRHRS